MDAHWERGYRCHGYWQGKERIGWVGLSPRHGGDNPLLYWPHFGELTLGPYKTLKAAKLAVERAVEKSCNSCTGSRNGQLD